MTLDRALNAFVHTRQTLDLASAKERAVKIEHFDAEKALDVALGAYQDACRNLLKAALQGKP